MQTNELVPQDQGLIWWDQKEAASQIYRNFHIEKKSVRASSGINGSGVNLYDCISDNISTWILALTEQKNSLCPYCPQEDPTVVKISLLYNDCEVLSSAEE